MREIISLSVMTAAKCNLNCSFCYLHKNEYYKKYDDFIQTSWANGTYLTNIKKTLNKLDVDYDGVTMFQLWGGETLLSINNFTSNIKNICNTFPNLECWRISTNWMINIDDLIQFIQELEKNTKQETELKIQLSIDGPPGIITETGHNGNWDIYYQHIDKFCDAINNIYLDKLKIVFSINATVRSDIYLQYFNTYDNIKTYVAWMLKFSDYIKHKCINRNLRIETPYPMPGYAVPYDCTVQDGLELAKICRLWELVRANEFPTVQYNFGFYNGISNLTAEGHWSVPNIECGELNGSLTILPDGSICQCTSSFVEHEEEYLQELIDNKEFDELQKAKRLSQHHFNPINMTEEELEQVDWYITYGSKNNATTYLHMMMIVCDEMAQSGQIPYYYHENKDKLLDILTAMANTNTCMRENLRDTGNIFITNHSCFRRYVNGLMQYAMPIEEHTLKQERKIKI